MITAWKLGPAIAAGNTLVIKTPEAAPLWAQKLASLVQEAGFPPGVINILCGLGSVAGQALAEHPGVKKLSFTGSTAVGRSILKAAATSNLKRVTLELGGKGPCIVFSDADLENALFWTSLGITSNKSQVCVAGSRIYVQDSIYDEFIEAFSDRSRNAVQGDPVLTGTTKGPVINSSQHAKVLGYIERAKGEGGRLLHGGERLDTKGYFVPNTAFADVPQSAAIMKEELFGPVAVSPWSRRYPYRSID